MGTELPPTEQFLRLRVRPERATRLRVRALLRASGVLAALSALTALGFWTAAAAGRAGQLSVATIVVEGNHRVASGEILEALGLHPGTNILGLDLPALKQQLLRSAWVRDAEIRRVLPSTVTLTIEERVPVGIAALGRLYLMDAEGFLLDEMGPRYQDLTLPLVQGLTEAGVVVKARAETAGRVLSALAKEPRLEAAVSELDVSEGAASLSITLRHPPLTLRGAEESFLKRLAEFLPLATDIVERFPTLETVDLRFRDRTYLKLRPSTGRTTPQGGDPF